MLSRAPLYQIDRGAYLYAPQGTGGGNQQPEEEVRQWCAFELIRAYSYSIADLTFEHEVKGRLKILSHRYLGPEKRCAVDRGRMQGTETPEIGGRIGPGNQLR